jgi:hypothetical protein
MAVPFLTDFMYDEWSSKQKKLRSANRMVSKGRSQALRHGPLGSSDGDKRLQNDKKKAALELCKSHGIYVFTCVTYLNVLALSTRPSVVPSPCCANSVAANGARGHDVHASVVLCLGSPQRGLLNFFPALTS